MASIPSGPTLCYCPYCSYYSLKLPVQSTRSLRAVYTQSPLPVVSYERIYLDQMFLWPRLPCCFLYLPLNVQLPHCTSSTRLHTVFFVSSSLHLFRNDGLSVQPLVP